MDRQNLTLETINSALFSAVPELSELVRSVFGSYYELCKTSPDQNPEPYLIFEDVVQRLIFDLLETNENETLLTRIFGFFEDMANSRDPNVSRDLLGIAILEPLVYEKAKIRAAWKFMGPKMKELAAVEAKIQGRQEYIPSA